MTENDVIAAMKRCYSFCRCIRGLDETEWRLLRLRYGLNGGPKHTLDEIAKELGTNAEAVSAIERGITSTLKTYAYRM